MISIDRDLHRTVATVTMRRPERRNALDAELVGELTGAIRDLGAMPEVRVIVLTGEGSAFSAGADLAALERLQTADLASNLADSRHLAGLFRAVIEAPVPVIARVNGHAIAGGCGLAAACDVSIAVQEAQFGFTEVRIGFVPAIVSAFLVRRMAGAHLRDLLLTGRLIGAEEAVRLGLASRVVAGQELDAVVSQTALSLARDTSREAVAATKRLVAELDDLEWPESLERAIEANAAARGTDDCRAGVKAFLTREDPPWRRNWVE